MTRPRRITIGLLWHSVNSDNFGVGALTLSHIAFLDRLAGDLGLEVDYLVIGWRDGREAYVTGPRVAAFRLRPRNILAPLGGLYGAVRGCDLVLDIGAGDSFADIYGRQRFVYQAVSKLVVLLARRPLVLAPQTIGPFERSWTGWVAARIMGACRAVVARDHMSFEAVMRLGLPTRCVESTDIAFCLPYDPPAGERRGAIKVGVNVSGLLFHGGYDRRNMFGLKADYPRLARDLLRGFAARGDCELHLVSHVVQDGASVDDDMRVAELLHGEVPGAILAPRFASPSEAKSYIAGMDFFCGSRMHACIAALSAGVPVVPMAYSRKFTGLFESLGYPVVADCRSESAADILARVLEAFEDRETLRTFVAHARAAADEKLEAYRELLRGCLGDVLGGGAS